MTSIHVNEARRAAFHMDMRCAHGKRGSSIYEFSAREMSAGVWMSGGCGFVGVALAQGIGQRLGRERCTLCTLGSVA